MRLKTVLGILVIAGSIPFAAATGHLESESVSGRMILFDLTQYDPDLAAVAGLAEGKSSWFNGVVVLDKESDGWVYAVPKGSDDPTGKNLYPTGQHYNFTDDNGASWNVQEWVYIDAEEVQYMLGNQLATERRTVEVPVWTVKTGDATTDALSGQRYNFVVVVDVTFLTGEAPAEPEVERTAEIDLYFLRHDPADRCMPCMPSRI